tara:strand:- start:1257 stop:1469 length:213 start_codon:yes stop_codon:yes gene_type:complete
MKGKTMSIPKFEVKEEKIIQEFKFEITIDGVDGTLYYSVDAESEQEAREMVSYFLESQPFRIEHKLWDNN